MIDYSKLNDPEYFKDVLSGINNITDHRILSDHLKILSIKITNKEVDPIIANMLLSTIRNRDKVLTDARIKSGNNNRSELLSYPTSNDWEGGGSTNSFQGNSNNQEKRLSLAPTSVSNHSGSVSFILIIAGVAVTTFMYTLLYISSITR